MNRLLQARSSPSLEPGTSAFEGLGFVSSGSLTSLAGVAEASGWDPYLFKSSLVNTLPRDFCCSLFSRSLRARSATLWAGQGREDNHKALTRVRIINRVFIVDSFLEGHYSKKNFLWLSSRGLGGRKLLSGYNGSIWVHRRIKLFTCKRLAELRLKAPNPPYRAALKPILISSLVLRS